MRIFVTGGAGFIGSALVRHLIENTDHEVLNFDKLTYAGTLTTVERVANSNRSCASPPRNPASPNSTKPAACWRRCEDGDR